MKVASISHWQETAEERLIAALEPLTSRARTDVTAVKGENGMAWTREALTTVRLKRHLDGGPARGVCPIKEGESTTRIALFDLDSHKGATPWPEMVEYASNIVFAASRIGVYLTAFRSSGGRGIHLFAIWDEPQDAYSVRQHLKLLLLNMGLKDGAKGLANNEVEVFPKQDSVPEGGFGNQFILPLAGKSAPLEPLCDYEVMPREYASQLEWKPSKPVQVLEKPVREITISDTPVALTAIRAALAAIPNDTDPLGYDEWRDVVSGTHHATGGSDEGYALAYEFSARAPHFNEDELREKVWDWLSDKGHSSNPITERTIFAMARSHGWSDVTADDFEDLTPAVVDPAEPLPRPAYQRDVNGKIEAVLGNVRAALLRPDVCGMDIRFDQFRFEIVFADAKTPNKWLAFKDHHAVELRWKLEGMGFKPVGRELMRDVVNWIAQMHSVDSAQVWLSSLKWDGVRRVDRFYATYFGVQDSAYTTAVSRYIWTAMAGRVRAPGIQADMVPILTGAQGQKKTSGVRAMVPEDTFRELSFHQSEEERARLMRGCLMVELGELSGLRTRENEQIKAWITRRKEDWTPKYREFAVSMHRRCVMQGTSNPTELLDDPTGERRWLPMASGPVDVDAIARDRDQLWAEADQMFAAGGVAWQDAQALAGDEHAAYRVVDSWEEALARWLDTPSLDGSLPGAEAFTTHQALVEGLNFRENAIKRTDEMRAAKAIKALGYVQKVRKTAEKRSFKVWVSTIYDLATTLC
ncbi:hypothetical protein GVN24_23255 [Rhizobium sp. CRIBSB]|nr:hypothetical protein [Rhizobium sp. CRIBSB]